LLIFCAPSAKNGAKKAQFWLLLRLFAVFLRGSAKTRVKERNFRWSVEDRFKTVLKAV